MKFTFMWVGRTSDKNWKALQEEYLRRLSHFVACEIVEIKESKEPGTKETEGKRFLEILNQKKFVCLFDVKGKAISSPGLAQQIETWQTAFGQRDHIS